MQKLINIKGSSWWNKLNSSSSFLYNAAWSLANKTRKICKTSLKKRQNGDNVEIEEGDDLALMQHCREDELNDLMAWFCFTHGGRHQHSTLSLWSRLHEQKTFEVWVATQSQPPLKNKYTHMEKLRHQQVPLEFSEQGSFFQETWKPGAEPSKHRQLCNCVNKIINDSMVKRPPMTVGVVRLHTNMCTQACAAMSDGGLLEGLRRMIPPLCRWQAHSFCPVQNACGQQQCMFTAARRTTSCPSWLPWQKSATFCLR